MRFKLLILLFFAGNALQVQAINFFATNEYTVAENTVVSDEQWVTALKADLDGTFENDLFLMSQSTLELKGTFEGNLWNSALLTTELSGNCKRNVRLFSGQSIKINGAIKGNLMAIADTIIVGTNAVIHGDTVLVGNSVVLEGQIDGDARINALRIINFSGTIKGNTQVSSQKILFDQKAQLLGDLNYTAPEELFFRDGVVGGAVMRTEAPSPFSANRLRKILISFLAAIVVGLPFIALFPMTVAMASGLIRKSPMKCIWFGFIGVVLLPMIGLMAISSQISIPLGTLIFGAWGTLIYLSRIISALVLGTLILRSGNSTVGKVLLSMTVGLAIVYMSSIVPSLVGILIQMIFLLLGMGSLILSLLERRRMVIQIPSHLKQLEKLRDEKLNLEED